MSTFILILVVASIAYLILFHKPYHYTESDLKKWFSSKLIEISVNLENDIEKDKKGEYAHAGQQTFDKRGAITYLLVDKHYARFDVSDTNRLSTNDIIGTVGYETLESKAHDLGLVIQLEEKDVEGDGVVPFNDIDEYIDDYPRYYVVTLSGW